MKQPSPILLALIIMPMALSAQQQPNALPTQDTPLHLAAGATLPSGQVVRMQLDHPLCLTDEGWAEINAEADANVAALAEDRPDLLIHDRGGQPAFIWPTRAKEGFDDYGYYTVNFLYDHNNAPNSLLDYGCGTRTYDWSTGNHRGTDIILWPYAWRRMDEGVMEVVAAAPGTIVIRRDGHPDQQCANDGNGNWNGYVIQHADGSRAWYMHFKTGSLSAKGVGETVEAGEFLGLAGSSGSSNWPHLHFEVRRGNGTHIDPWDGPCNTTNPGESWWAEQQPYMVPWINRISTHYSIQHDNTCPQIEESYEEEFFNAGDSLVLKLYYRDLNNGSVTNLRVIRPDGTTHANWNFTSQWSFMATTYVYWTYVLDNTWPNGQWTFRAVLNGNTYQRTFFVGTEAQVEEEATTLFNMLPNPAQDMVLLEGIVPHVNGTWLRVYDSMGRVVTSEQVNSDRHVLDVAPLSNGLYTVEMIVGEDRGTRKLIVQH